MASLPPLLEQAAEHDRELAVAVVGGVPGGRQQVAAPLPGEEGELAGFKAQTRQPYSEQAHRLFKGQPGEDLSAGPVDRLAAVQVVGLDLLPAYGGEVGVA